MMAAKINHATDQLMLTCTHPTITLSRIDQLMGEDCVMLNAAEAERRQLRDGQRVTLGGNGALFELTLRIADIVPAGTALTYKTRWPKLNKQGINVNALNPGLRADMAGSTALHGVEVDIAAV